MLRILLIDDETGVLSALTRLLRARPPQVGPVAAEVRVETFTLPALALARAAECAFDLVVSDFRMPEMDGLAVLRRMRELQPQCARIILSGYADLNTLISAINEARIDRFIAKPWNDFELVTALTQVLEIRALRMENEALADQMRCQRGVLTDGELELKRLELLEPGITQVEWGLDGSIVIDMDSIAEGLEHHDE